MEERILRTEELPEKEGKI
jgi:hypothetical protein